MIGNIQRSKSAKTRRGTTLISIVVPAHNEEYGIKDTVQAIYRVMQSQKMKTEVIIVDDGSLDRTFDCIQILGKQYKSLKGIRFSRNFGKEAALLAGLQAARGNAVITIDADLQHPPGLIPEMISKWRQGASIVHAVKQERAHDGPMIRLRAGIFNGVLKLLGGIDIRNSSDFKLLDRVAVDVIVNELKERRRFYRGLASWIGFRQESIPFEVLARTKGASQWSTRALIGLATTGIISFTSMPLRIVSILGFFTLILAIGVTVDAIWSWYQGMAVSGFATMIISLLIIGSFIMISLGVMGEYVAKIYDEVKGRPNYLVEMTCGFEQQT